jgi:hypothetical protein
MAHKRGDAGSQIADDLALATGAASPSIGITADLQQQRYIERV